jgi:hypothetical protein
VWYVSPADSGYSVDNLAPSPPAHLRWDAPANLAWDAVPEPDFDYYTVYGSASDVLDGSAVVLEHTSGTTATAAGYPYYHVTATDFAGNEGDAGTITDPAVGAAVVVEIPETYSLAPNRPNPFRGGTTIRFGLPQPGRVRLEVHDVSGRRVRTLCDGERPAGVHTVAWRGRDDRGLVVSPGVYFVRLRAGAFTATRKALLLE